MNSKKLIRFTQGIKSILIHKRNMLCIIIYLSIMLIIWFMLKERVPVFNYLSLPKLYLNAFNLIMILLSFFGVLQIIILLGTPRVSKKTEQGLLEIGFVDKNGNPPILLSVKKERNVVVLEFYSPRIPFYKYEEFKEEIETVRNIKIISINVGKDMQHILIKAISSYKSTQELILWDNSFIDSKDFNLVLGESYDGVEVFDLSKIPHVLIGGASGSGKTLLLKLLLVQCIKKNATIYIADFKGGVDYSKAWYEKCTIVIDAESLNIKLAEILELMEDRRKLLIDAGTPNIVEYNEKTNSNLQRIIVSCDEIAEVLDKTGLDKEEKVLINQIESKLSTIARQGRAFGIHLILATQRPDADVLKGQIKNNIGMRICGRADKVLSQIILDNSDGAEKISQSDQGMFLTNQNVLFKAYYINENCLEEIIKNE